ncbi:hypothetical protein BOTBODRAFT_170892, partial [Botryobasidium botryosum FD-172 SS1]
MGRKKKVAANTPQVQDTATDAPASRTRSACTRQEVPTVVLPPNKKAKTAHVTADGKPNNTKPSESSGTPDSHDVEMTGFSSKTLTKPSQPRPALQLAPTPSGTNTISSTSSPRASPESVSNPPSPAPPSESHADSGSRSTSHTASRAPSHAPSGASRASSHAPSGTSRASSHALDASRASSHALD